MKKLTVDSIGYILGKRFILVAVTLEHEFEKEGKKIIIKNARKAYKLSPSVLATFLGNPYKATGIRKYLWELSKLDKEYHIEAIIDDLHDAFNTAQKDFTQSTEKIVTTLKRFATKDGNVDLKLVEQHLESDEQIALFRDVVSAHIKGHVTISITSLFGYNEDAGIEVINLLGVGNQLTETRQGNFSASEFRMLLASTSGNDDQELKQKLTNRFIPYLVEGWEDNPIAIANILDQARPILYEGINSMMSLNEDVSVIFYELSHRTNFEFLEPGIELGNVDYVENQNV